MTAASASFAAAMAASAVSVAKAFSLGSRASMRASTARVTSTGETSFRAIRSRNSEAGVKQRSSSLMRRLSGNHEQQGRARICPALAGPPVTVLAEAGGVDDDGMRRTGGPGRPPGTAEGNLAHLPVHRRGRRRCARMVILTPYRQPPSRRRRGVTAVWRLGCALWAGLVYAWASSVSGKLNCQEELCKPGQ